MKLKLFFIIFILLLSSCEKGKSHIAFDNFWLWIDGYNYGEKDYENEIYYVNNKDGYTKTLLTDTDSKQKGNIYWYGSVLFDRKFSRQNVLDILSDTVSNAVTSSQMNINSSSKSHSCIIDTLHKRLEEIEKGKEPVRLNTFVLYKEFALELGVELRTSFHPRNNYHKIADIDHFSFKLYDFNRNTEEKIRKHRKTAIEESKMPLAVLGEDPPYPFYSLPLKIVRCD